MKFKFQYIFVFLNKKLISCDTILPITIEIKKKNPEVNIKYITFDRETYNLIRENLNIYNLINKHANLLVLGWHFFQKPGFLTKFFKILHLLKIIILSIFCRANNIHFKGLEKFPFSLIYYFNKKGTYLFDSNCWGENKNILYADYILDQRKISDTKVFPPFKNYNYLVAFDNNWYQLKYAKKNKKSFYKIRPSRSLPSWIESIKREAKEEILKKPFWYNKNSKYMVYILGTLGLGISSIEKEYSGERLLKETLDIIMEYSDYHILFKPHVITDISKLKSIIDSKYADRCFIVYNHIAVLSRICDVVIGNYFSQAMPDAWLNGARVIEYTKYDPKVLKYCNNSSISSDFVDIFINNEPNILIQELQNDIIKVDRKILDNLEYQTDILIEKISFAQSK